MISRKAGLIFLIVGISVGLTVAYSNCAQPGNSLSTTNPSSGWPANMIAWRPNHIASFSCGPDGLQGGQPTTYKYPSFLLWYVNDSTVSGTPDKYPAGLSLSPAALDFIGTKNLNPKQILGNLTDMQPAFELINSADDSKPTATGWYPSANADPSQLFIDFSFHTSQVASALANSQTVGFNEMRTTTKNYPPVQNAFTSFSLGLLFHTADQGDPSSNLTFDFTSSNGTTEKHVAGEALKFYVYGRAFEQPNGSEAVLPFNTAGLDRAQQNTIGGHSHSWLCERYLVTVPGDNSGNCVTSDPDALPQNLGDVSKILSLGSFGKWAGVAGGRCFIPNTSSPDRCYQPGFDPIATATSPGNNKPAWVTSPTPWRFADSQSPHWLSLCYRQTN
jgi:hypothetical protein